MIQIVLEGKYIANTLFQLEHTVFDSEQQTPIFYNGHLFGIRQIDKQFVCLDLTGKVVWSSGRQETFGSGPSIVAGGMILVLDDFGKLSGIEPTPTEFRKLFEVEDVVTGGACWAPVAIIQGRLLLRSQFAMKCIDLRE